MYIQKISEMGTTRRFILDLIIKKLTWMDESLNQC